MVIVHCNIVSDDYQYGSRILFTFGPNKSFGQLLDISRQNFIFLKSFNSEFLCMEVWFTGQNFEPPEMEYKTNITLLINV